MDGNWAAGFGRGGGAVAVVAGDSRIGSGLGVAVINESRTGEEDSDGEGGEGVYVDVFGGDAVCEGRIWGGDGFFLGAGGDAEGIGGGLVSGLEAVFEEEFEEDTVELDTHTRHCLCFLFLFFFFLREFFGYFSLFCSVLWVFYNGW